MKALLLNTEATPQSGGTIQPAGDVRIQTMQSPAPGPVNFDRPAPPEIKGKVFDISDEPDIDYEDNKDAAPKTDFKEPEKKPAEQKPVEAPKAPEQKPETPKLNAKLPETPQTKVQKQEHKGEARDYSVFPEEVRDVLKQTSNQAFDFVRQTFQKLQTAEQKVKSLESVEQENKKLQEGGFPSQWYTHPEAWRLHPHAQKELHRAQMVEQEEAFWVQQLDLITEGKPYRILRGYQNGQPVYSDPIEPSEKAKNEILRHLGGVGSLKQQLYVGLNTFAQSFQGSMRQQETEIQKIIDSEWPWHKDEKHEAQKWVKEFMGVVPEERQGDYMAKVASLLYASLQKAHELLAQKAQEEKVEGIREENNRSVEPKVTAAAVTAGNGRVNFGNGKGYKPPTTFSLDNME